MKQPKREKMPRLPADVKAMNGRSTRRLDACIDALTDILDEKDEHNEVAQDPDTDTHGDNQ